MNETDYLNAVYLTAKGMLLDMGIPVGNVTKVTVNRRAMRRWGQCAYHPTDGHSEINISVRLLDGKHEYGAYSTMLHELLHTVKGCQNHGTKWKEYASMVTAKTGYCVKRGASYEEYGFQPPDPEANAKYKFKCLKCGEIVCRNRASDFTRNPYNYLHKGCGGRFAAAERKG
jgi:predicted SprT family Zn-dependent metalloprotease